MKPPGTTMYVSSAARMSDLLHLTKPGIIAMAVVTAVVGYLVAPGGAFQVAILLAAAVGIGLVGAGGNVLNMLMERHEDSRMERTSDRPLPAGRLVDRDVLLYGVVLATAGWMILALAVNHLTALLAAFTFASYLFLYTPLKRETAFNTLVGAVPGALPPVLGWTAATGDLGWGAAALFLLLFLWQLPHFWPLAWLLREDYARGGFRMLSLTDEDGRHTARASLLAAGLLVIASLLLPLAGLGGVVYLAAAILVGGAFLGLAVDFSRHPRRSAARRLFLSSLLYLPVVLGVLVVDVLVF